jgi:hypothetical protein
MNPLSFAAAALATGCLAAVVSSLACVWVLRQALAQQRAAREAEAAEMNRVIQNGIHLSQLLAQGPAAIPDPPPLPVPMRPRRDNLVNIAERRPVSETR